MMESAAGCFMLLAKMVLRSERTRLEQIRSGPGLGEEFELFKFD